MRRVAGTGAVVNVFADWALIAEVGADQLVINQANRWRGRAVAVGEFTPAEERNAQRREVLWARHCKESVWRRIEFDALNLKRLRPVGGQRQLRADCGLAHSRQRGSALQQALIEAGDLGVVIVALPCQRDGGGQRVVGIEAKAGLLNANEAANHQPRNDQQHQSQRNFCNHQRLANAFAPMNR